LKKETKSRKQKGFGKMKTRRKRLRVSVCIPFGLDYLLICCLFICLFVYLFVWYLLKRRCCNAGDVNVEPPVENSLLTSIESEMLWI